MIISFSLLVGFLASFWGLAWVALKLAERLHWTSLTEAADRGHFQAIDGLRGVLALSVFISHAHCARNWCLTNHWSIGEDAVFKQGGVYAVTLFFFITGFVFWTKLQRDPRPNVRQHLRSRVARLAPAYWGCLAVIFFYVFFWLKPEWILTGLPLAEAGKWTDRLLFLLPTSKLLLPPSDPLLMNMFTGVTWTLQREWWLYLLIPFCGWFVGMGRRTVYFFLLVGLLKWGANSAPGLAVLPEAGIAIINLVTDSFLTLFSGGILAAVFRHRFQGRLAGRNFRHPGYSWLGLGLVCFVVLLAPPEYGGGESALLFVPFLLIVLGNDWFGLLTSRPMLFLGKISYSIYLTHLLLIYFTFITINRYYPARNLTATEHWLIIAALGGVLIAVSAFWYRWLEKPFMHVGVKARPVADPARLA